MNTIHTLETQVKEFKKKYAIPLEEVKVIQTINDVKKEWHEMVPRKTPLNLA